MDNKKKRSLFLLLIIVEVIIFLGVVMFKDKIAIGIKWGLYLLFGIVLDYLCNSFRRLNKIVKEESRLKAIENDN